MNTDQTVAPTDPMDKILDDAQAYEPTPQEIRWGLIEHHARDLVTEIRKRGVIGMTGEAHDALNKLARTLGMICETSAPPLVK